MELVVGEENFESTRLSVQLPSSRSLAGHLALAPPATKVSQLRNCHFPSEIGGSRFSPSVKVQYEIAWIALIKTKIHSVFTNRDTL